MSFPFELKDVALAVVAAKARLARWDGNGSLQVRGRALALQGLRQAAVSSSLDRLAWLAQWQERTFLCQIARAAAQVQAARRALPQTPDWWTEPKEWQRQATLLLRPAARTAAARHWERRLAQWPLQLLPGHRLPRARAALQELGAHCQPRVLAACIRTQLNGWCTSTRGQGACRLPTGLRAS